MPWTCSGLACGKPSDQIKKCKKNDKTYKFREEPFGPYLTHSDGAPVFKVGPYVTFTDVWIQLRDEESMLLETDEIGEKLLL